MSKQQVLNFTSQSEDKSTVLHFRKTALKWLTSSGLFRIVFVLLLTMLIAYVVKQGVYSFSGMRILFLPFLFLVFKLTGVWKEDNKVKYIVYTIAYLVELLLVIISIVLIAILLLS